LVAGDACRRNRGETPSETSERRCLSQSRRHGPRIELCRLNSGAATQKNHPLRGHRCWLPIADYPYDEYRRRYGRDGALVGVTVLDAVPDILDLTNEVEGATG
jgi:hypothetical protein